MIKINKGKVPAIKTPIPPLTDLHLSLVNFSFKYLDMEHSKFCLPNTVQKDQYLEKFFDRFKHISTMKCAEFRGAGKALRSHKIVWDDTTEPDGYSHLSYQMQQCEPWQISLARENFGRIHGMLLDNVFYVVWIDHDHKLYSKNGF